MRLRFRFSDEGLIRRLAAAGLATGFDADQPDHRLDRSAGDEASSGLFLRSSEVELTVTVRY